MSIPENIESYAGRLATFEAPHRLQNRRTSANKKKVASTTSWPKTAPPAEEMARAGFWYKPVATNPDNARCFLCGTELDGWEPDDDPVDEHFRHSSKCGWAINVSIRSRLGDENRVDEDPMDLEMVEARKVTFLGKWPHEGKKGWKPKIQKMIEAGWCYDPSPEADDGTTCFYCSLSLDGWEPKDNPMDEHKKRSPDCAFFELLERFGASRPKKGKKGRASTQSKASRLSTQSNLTVDTEAPSLMSVDEGPGNVEDSILSTATNATTASKAGKSRKGASRARASAKSTTGAKKGGRGKKQSAIEASLPDLDVGMMDFDLGPPDDEMTPEPPRKVARTTAMLNDSIIEQGSSVGPAGSRRTTRQAAPKAKAERPSKDHSRIYDEIVASGASMLSEEGTPKPRRGTKRTSDGAPKIESSVIIADAPIQSQNQAADKPKRGRKGKKASAEMSELPSSSQADIQPKTGGRIRANSKIKRGKFDSAQELETQDIVERTSEKPVAPSSPPQAAAPELPAAPDLPENTPSPHQTPSASPPPPTPTPAKVAPASMHRSTPVRPRISNASGQAEQTPCASPQSPDAENRPPSSRPPVSARQPLGALSANPRTVQVALAASTPTASPSKRNAFGALKSAFPWEATDLENVFLPSPSGKTLGRSSGFGFGNATNLTRQEQQNLAALDEFAANAEKKGKLQLDEVVSRVKLGLTSPEKKMTVEEWVNYNAKRGEERLRGECERLVGIFEREGGRALQTLEGLECAN